MATESNLDEANTAASGSCDGSANTDRELWRQVPGDYYAPSIHGFMRMFCGGLVS